MQSLSDAECSVASLTEPWREQRAAQQGVAADLLTLEAYWRVVESRHPRCSLAANWVAASRRTPSVKRGERSSSQTLHHYFSTNHPLPIVDAIRTVSM
jgi:hypothetical protein